MCLHFRKLPDDPFFEEMDPWIRLWFYEGWVHEQELQNKRDRSIAILTGSFYNPEMAQKMVKQDEPDFATTDEEEAMEFIRKDRARQQAQEEAEESKHLHRRKRRKILRD